MIVRENIPRKESFQEKEVQTYSADGNMMQAVETAVGPFIEVFRIVSFINVLSRH